MDQLSSFMPAENGSRASSLLLALILFTITNVVSAGTAENGTPPEIKLPAKSRGPAAIEALGPHLETVAAHYGTTGRELAARFRKDSSLWLDERGRLFHVCKWPVAGDPAGGTSDLPPTAAPFDLNDTFRLHSRPGATKVIYLDFDGHNASTTIWGNDAVCRPFSLDNNDANFSATERERIQLIWQRVAEDFIQYEVDVTTEDPGVEALRRSGPGDASYGVRVAIGGDSDDWYGSGAGGVAYLSSFDWDSDTPCWVFPRSLSNSEKNIAEAASHEAGHTFNLSHDGKTDGTEYYTGQGNWAPIMGVGYSKSIVQWSKGEYTGANNTEDDLGKMLGEGIAYRADDHGNAIASATPLSGISFATSALITQNTDRDFFRFETGAGQVRLIATPASPSGNLHISLALYNSSGVAVTSIQSTDNASTGVTPVTLSTTVAAGTYYVSVDGLGSGNPSSTGYSDYSSIGQYRLQGLLPGDSVWLPDAGGVFAWMDTANWSSNTIPLGSGAIARLTTDLLGDQSVTLDRPITIGALYLGDAVPSHSFTLEPDPGATLTFSDPDGTASLTRLSGAADIVNIPIVLSSTLSITNVGTGPLTFTAPISGAGGVRKAGLAPVIFEGAHSFAGALVVAEGGLTLGTTASVTAGTIEVFKDAVLDVQALAGGIVVQPGQTLSGSGSILGDAAISGTLSPGGNLLAGTLALSNNLVLNAGSTLKFDLATTTEAGGETNDFVIVEGGLSIAGIVSVDLQFLKGQPASPGVYTLLQYSGPLTGSAADLTAVNGSNRFSFQFDDSVPGQIRLLVEGAPLTNLVWNGDTVLNSWDVGGSLNWSNGASLDYFAQLDHVRFDDFGAATQSVSLVGALNPGSLVVDSSSNYVFGGSGKLSGNFDLTKGGSGVLTLNSANDFTGPVSVTEGVLKLGNPEALGAAAVGTSLSGTGGLDLNGLSVGEEPVTAAGPGPTNSGAIFSSSAAGQKNALRFLTFAGDTALGGIGRWDVRANPTGALAGNNFNLTKIGPNEIWLAELGNTGLRDIFVEQGTLGLEGNTSLGDSTRDIVLSAGTTLALAKTETTVPNKHFYLNGSTLRSDPGNNSLAGLVTLSGTATNTVYVSHTLDIQGAIGGSGGLLKSGTGMLSLGSPNTFAGPLIVNAGTLRIVGTGSLGATNGPTIINSGAALDLNGINIGAEPLVVQGSGFGVSGVIYTFTTQQNAIRFITLSGNTTFGGISRWDVRANPTAGFDGNNFSLTKIGPNEIWLANVGPTELGSITISSGLLGFQGDSTLGNTSSTLTISSLGSLGINAAGTNILAKNIALNGGRIYNAAGSNTLSRTLTLSGSNRLDSATGTYLHLAGNVTGASGLLHKLNPGTVVLSGNNSYQNTLISTGTLQVGAGETTGTLGNGTVTVNGTLTFNRANDFLVANLIGGTGGVIKQGAGVMTLSGANTYSGQTTVQAGTLRAANSSALGLPASPTVVLANGTLDINAQNLGAEPVILAGTLVNNSAVSQPLALRYLTLNSHGTVGGIGRFDIRNSGSGGTFNGQGFNLFKVGSNQVWLADLGQINVGNITISNGTLVVEGSTDLGNPAGTVAIMEGSSLAFSSLSVAIAKTAIIMGGTLQSFSGTNLFAGDISLTASNTINVSTDSLLSLTGAISGAGSLVKVGTGVLELGGAHTYSGGTWIAGGIVRVLNPESLSTTPLISLAPATSLDFSGLASYTSSASNTLIGEGVVIGNVTIGGAISPGFSIGRLTFVGDLALAGSTSLEVVKTGGTITNDVIEVSQALNLGGALVVSHSGDPLSDGDSFQVVSAASIGGNFSTRNLPVLDPGLHWDTTELATAGILRVTASSLPPTILPVVLDGTNLVISVLSENETSYVLESTLAIEAPGSWYPIQTNLGTGGLLNFSVPVDQTQTRQFFRMVIP